MSVVGNSEKNRALEINRARLVVLESSSCQHFFEREITCFKIRYRLPPLLDQLDCIIYMLLDIDFHRVT